MKDVVTVQQASNKTSAYIVIPKPLKEFLSLNKGDRVILEAKEDGTLIIKK